MSEIQPEKQHICVS